MATSLADWARDRIARVQATEGFRRAAGAFPLTRPVARWRARALFDLCAGFVYSQVLLATVQLRLPERLMAGPRSAASLALELDMTESAMERLLNAGASLRLMARRGQDAGGRALYGLGALGAALIDNPGVTAMIEHHGMLYDDLRDPVALLRGETTQTSLANYWPYAKGAGEGAATPDGYTALMAASQRFVSAEVLGIYPLRRHRHLLDVGGGNGAFLMAAGAHAPNLRMTLFDLPPVARLARDGLAASPVATRCDVVAGDFTTESLPTGADLVSLVRVLHDHDDDVARVLLRAIRVALPPGGTLLIAEPMAQTRGAAPVGDAYFGFYFLAMGGGCARTPARIKQMLLEAGFSQTRLLRGRMPMVARVMLAQ
ncbi:methyltransferase [Acidisoma cladoniae]|uniref:methyltransferase n=1 Tax=Acidisoma cladoniae TaxID=3040935 RepID=UPI00254A8B05|nr:methyltransferase [Acidisoma sp. PAMC 29798]